MKSKGLTYGERQSLGLVANDMKDYSSTSFEGSGLIKLGESSNNTKDKCISSILAGALVSIGLLLVPVSFLFHRQANTIKPSTLTRSHQTIRDNAIAIHDVMSLQKKPPQPFMFDKVFSSITNEPLSFKSPAELGIPVYERPKSSLPGSVFGSVQKGAQIGVPLPTNEWYLNLIVGLDDNAGEKGQYENYAGEENRVYTIPYVVDTVGPIVGMRMHYPNIVSYGTVVQSVFVSSHGLTMGTLDKGFTRRYELDAQTLPSKLGIGIRWEGNHSHKYVRSSILRGMPYGTLEYAHGVKPVLASEIVAALPIIDDSQTLQCGKLETHSNRVLTTVDSILAKKSIELYFPESDFTWHVFFSRPVRASCFFNPTETSSVSLPPGVIGPKPDNLSAFQLRLQDAHEADDPLIVRVALANNCTSGTNVNFCHQNKPRDQSQFMSILREHVTTYPTSPFVKYSFSDPEGALSPEKPESKSAYLFFDWKAKHFTKHNSKELIMFALPHHIDILRTLDGKSSNELLAQHCAISLHGTACLVKGGLWAMEEELGGLPSFLSPRPASHKVIPALAKALSKDIHYSLEDNFRRGASDTYFSGKMLAKLGRIIVIAQELRGFAEQPDDVIPYNQEMYDIIKACKQEQLPTEDDVEKAVGRLREGVEVWLNGTALAPLTYDSSWGGINSCGCLFNGEACDNIYPNCPGYEDPGLNFGQGYYNDHHFHFGYHIYAAAILSEFDREWGRTHFEEVLLLIRDIANPSVKDNFFPVFRQKDWFLGNSWASGIALFGGRPYMNGRNQESSSEAIAAYEGVAMYGSVLMKAFGNGQSMKQSDNDNAYTACQVFNIGRFLAATELRSADRYWHVYSPKRDIIYPDTYKPAVVSMMWNLMCQFQTWFGNDPFLAYGIQLLPLTPISERRDADQWLRQLYPSFAESCQSSDVCTNEGWAVLLYAVLASLGHFQIALNKVLELPDTAFTSAGGSGHSLSNTLWYIASRPQPVVPYDLDEPSSSINSKSVHKSIILVGDCGCDACTEEALERNANGFTCKERIQWLMTNKGLSELGACKQVAGNEYPSICGICDPGNCVIKKSTGNNKSGSTDSPGCNPCSEEICASDLNRCQIATTPFLCYEGEAKGGCSAVPWSTGESFHCSECCEIFSGCSE